jgi:hypothetical protein
MMPDWIPHSAVDVKLDGHSVEIPAERRSLGGICAYLEAMALGKERILCSLIVDGERVNLTQPPGDVKSFASIEAETMGLTEVPVQLIRAALQQTIYVRQQVVSAVELVLINEGRRARELWWNLSLALKEPLLTLSLLPEGICGPNQGQASLMQLRKWQLQQLGAVIQDVNNACEWDDPAVLSDALEMRVMPWLDKLRESLELWHETMISAPRTRRRGAA